MDTQSLSERIAKLELQVAQLSAYLMQERYGFSHHEDMIHALSQMGEQARELHGLFEPRV